MLRFVLQGDAGGPLSIKEVDGTFRVIGSISWGNFCAYGYPRVNNRVGEMADWVTETINITMSVN